ncbi:unnamed protein product, partial [Amoebophrya sp. A25]
QQTSTHDVYNNHDSLAGLQPPNVGADSKQQVLSARCRKEVINAVPMASASRGLSPKPSSPSTQRRKENAARRKNSTSPQRQQRPSETHQQHGSGLITKPVEAPESGRAISIPSTASERMDPPDDRSKDSAPVREA